MSYREHPEPAALLRFMRGESPRATLSSRERIDFRSPTDLLPCRFESYAERARSTAEAFVYPWPWMEELLRMPMAVDGAGMTKSKPLVLFAGLPVVLRKLRGKRSVKEVAAGAGLAKEQHLALLEHRPSGRRGSRVLPERAGKTPQLATLDSLLRFYDVSLSDLEALLQEVQSGGE